MNHLRSGPGGTLISPELTRLFIEVANGTTRLPDLAAKLGIARSTVHSQLTMLREVGLVSWVDGRRGTLRAVVKVPLDTNTFPK